MLSGMIELLYNALGKSNQPSPNSNIHIIDHTLNMLPSSAKDLTQQGHWIKTWTIILDTLHDIDILSHPDQVFEKESPPNT